MSVERCIRCEKDIDTDFMDGIYSANGFICSNCMDNPDNQCPICGDVIIEEHNCE